jgi:hypothetical protein
MVVRRSPLLARTGADIPRFLLSDCQHIKTALEFIQRRFLPAKFGFRLLRLGLLVELFALLFQYGFAAQLDLVAFERQYLYQDLVAFL